ncbi:hypothetical protein RB653_005419 [Dictyostelium firmibasis]|uniref:Lariat debranching enzyme C-terminal domain-containing protein n=1 Tax=Dictyostelium firmibasis TaxID=79012 RepID=A0AAN7U7X4_9MYCE
MRIAIEGCCHGEIETIYNSIVNVQKMTGPKIDLLLCCGDYEALRNLDDLKSLAVKPKYRTMGSFYKYYSGELKAPVLTLVVGGNHESSNFFSEINNGGWLCENIYFMGRSNVVNFGGIRIGGLSGIFKEYDYHKGYYETKPFSDAHLRSIYHIRELDIFKFMQISEPALDIVFSHDWPMGIIDYGDRNVLMRFKKDLIEDSDKGELGNPATMATLKHLRPKFWFAAHLHAKFAALVKHEDNNENNDNDNPTTTTTTTTTEPSTEPSNEPSTINNSNNNTTEPSDSPNDDKSTKKTNTLKAVSNNPYTRFLALDKVLPNRDFLQVLEFQQKVPFGEPLKLCYDPQWLLIQSKTKHISDTYNSATSKPLDPDLFLDLYTNEEVKKVEERFKDIYRLKNKDNLKENFTIQDALEIKKENFVKNTYCHNPNTHNPLTNLPPAFENPQNIVYENLIKIISQDTEITNETLKELDVKTYSGNLEELQKEQLSQRKNDRLQLQQSSPQEQQYKDESEIILDD